ncbi:MAG: MXAN_5187 C-terminal domain-containing protein [Candidatus Acidiferrales bacterium]
MPTVDEELTQLDREIRQLKIEYEMYFGGGRKRPPTDVVWRIDQVIKKHGDRGGQLNFSQRFRLNNLIQTYAKYQEMFRKRLKAKEEGTVQRHFGAAARAIEAERDRKRPAAAQADAAAPGAAGGVASGDAAPATGTGKRGKAARAAGYSAAISDPSREKEKVEELYNVLLSAKRQAGEKTDSLNFEGFQKFVKNKTAELKKQGKGDVEYTVTMEAGQVKLKARVKS